jgi:uncharacterized protein YjaG (DUF416 family)
MSFAAAMVEAYKSDSYQAMLRSRLQPLPPFHQIAFAASCANRLIRYYTTFCEQHQHDEAQDLRAIIDRVWQHVAGDMMDSTRINEYLRVLESIQFGEVDLDGRNAAIAAVNSVYLTVLACRENTLDNAVQSAQEAETVIYQHLMVRELGKSYVLHPNQIKPLHSRLAHDPLMFAEFSIQSAVLSFLSQHSQLGEGEVKTIQQLVQTYNPPES